MSHFLFLQPEWPEIFTAAAKAEVVTLADPRTACFYARRALELAVAWLYAHDPALRVPYQDNLSALIHDSAFRNVVGETLHAKIRIIKDLGNLAAHSAKPLRHADSIAAVRELFHFCYWFARTYARTPKSKPSPALAFDAARLPQTTTVPRQTAEQLKKLEEELKPRDEKIIQLGTARAAADEELVRLRAEIAEIKAHNTAQPDAHDYSESETRDYFIDLLLKEAGWPLDQPRDIEFEIAGMPNTTGKGFVDYVLWGDDGKPLGLVEAKRTRRDPQVGQQQAKLYADALQNQFGQRPVIFYSNGYEHWIWDDQFYPPRQVQGFDKKDELELLIQRRSTRQALAAGLISPTIVERYYQTRAIRRVSEAFEKDHDRRALLVMATGAGKTRTVIALCDLLMRCNWVKRVLFLADRVALVNQAIKAFKAHLPSAAPVNLVTEKNTEGRVYVSTYPTMMNLIEESAAGQRRFGAGHFDLVIIDEAHRSVYQKYRAIFEYFDSLLVGLTATPRDETDRDTYRLFGLEPGVPTDDYELDDAVADGFLVPARAVSVPLRFQREGIRYDDLSEEEKNRWDDLEWNEDGNVPDRVEAAAVNKWLFNEDTVDKVLAHLMTHGLKVADGDRLGKTIIFAANQDHANFIYQRFNANYPHYNGLFARVITFETEYAQTLIDDFSNPAKAPHIAISVDMLDTGIDVPEVLNLVFFKLVRSKTKFWQMVGRGTRLCPGLFGPGKHKEFFYIFDYCQNLEFFNENPRAAEPALTMPLGKRLFLARLELISVLDHLLPNPRPEPQPGTESELRASIAGMLHEEVAAMNVNNFVVRPKRKLIEKYREEEAWEHLSTESHAELANEVAGLPSALVDTDQDAKQFDLLMLRLQLALLRAEHGFTRLREQVQEIAGALAEKDSIPMVRAQMPLIQEVQTDEFWQDVTTPMLENVRRKLRSLIKLIDRTGRKPVYTDFEDEIGESASIDLRIFAGAGNFEKFRAKARHFLNEHKDHPSVRKLYINEPLCPTDLDELERLLTSAGVGAVPDLIHAREVSEGLGLFVRSLIGLDRVAAKAAFANFLDGRPATANQIEFINMIVEHVTEQGWMEPGLLYASPFVDLNPKGVDGIFDSSQVEAIISTLQEIKQRAVA
jgi:type I restriction enzyme R subunit